jgi:glycosyltransferase involved in cell wall biosynthesis
VADVSEYVEETEGHNLAFIGKMSYAPNILAVSNFVKNVLPLIRNKIPDVTFYIVGASPDRDVLKLHDGKKVIVTGFVENINEYFNLASIIVAPMLSGAGIQNKIIQAMGSGKCVVTTPIGAEGLIIKGEIAIEKNDNDMAERIIFLLSHKDVRCAMGKDARKYVQQNLSFDAISQQFYKLVTHLL